MAAFDVVVIGAGPAGSRAAWRLAREGARVAIIDGSHPREKPCGGGVTGRALAVVADAVSADALEGVTIRTATFAWDGRVTRMELPATGETPLVVMRRRDFDRVLRDAALAAGAVAVDARATGLARTNRGWTITTRGGAVHARWVLGADGVTSLVRRRVLRAFDRADLSMATGYYVHGASSSEIAIAFEHQPAGYLWSFPRVDHLAVGVCAQADDTTPSTLLPLAERWIEQNVGARHDQLERYSWPIPSLSVASLQSLPVSGDGWMLLGDAAGLVDPITREGIFFALQSADAAADALLGRGEPSRAYTDRVRRAIVSELVRAARLKARFFAPAFVGLLITALERSAGIRAVMADLVAGRQTYRGLRRRLLRTCEFRLMFDFLGLRSGSARTAGPHQRRAASA